MLASFTKSLGQQSIPYRVVMPREDGNQIVFNMDYSKVNGMHRIIIRNAGERLTVDSIQQKGDSLLVEMPFFDSRLRLAIGNDNFISGTWTKATTAGEATMPVSATPGIHYRFVSSKGNPLYNISGRYAVQFKRPDGTNRNSVAEFTQKGNILTGTFLNPSGDYRYLEGIVTGDSMMLSCFDGSHAYYFGAKISKSGKLTEGIYCSGVKSIENWSAVPDAKATVKEDAIMVYLKEGEDRLNFAFPDLDSNIVSINDSRFRSKVVIVQIMGSWCPNCMDETAFLSEYYRNNKVRGVEVVSLAYEYSKDFHRSEKTLRKLQSRYSVEYPMLITGATTIDSLKTEKTLPQLTPIKGFPTTIFIGKDGKVKKIHPGFTGPGTGSHYDEFKLNFETIINELLNEKATGKH